MGSTIGHPAPRLLNPFAVEHLLAQVRAERERQDRKWGEQNHPDGTGPAALPLVMLDPLWRADRCADVQREWVDLASGAGFITWRDILLEEVLEAAAAPDTQQLRTELIQVAALALQWAEAIDRREHAALEPSASA